MKIICVGMNYAKHIKELGAKTPTEPIIFIKPDTALLRNNEPFYIPSFSNEVFYECEVVVRINRVVKAIDETFAHRCYDEIGLGIDFTAKDLLTKCQKEGLPWEISKAFDHSAALSPRFIPKIELPENLNFTLELNGEQRQTGATEDMVFSINRIIAYVSNFVTLKIGDLIYTGTPSGVGSVAVGDRITASLEGQRLVDFEIK